MCAYEPGYFRSTDLEMGVRFCLREVPSCERLKMSGSEEKWPGLQFAFRLREVSASGGYNVL